MMYKLVTLWTAAHQAPPSMGFLQARVREWVAISLSVIKDRLIQKQSDTCESVDELFFNQWVHIMQQE